MKKLWMRVTPEREVWARSVVLWLAGFTLINLGMDWSGAGVSLNLWWIDLRFLPSWLADVWMLVFGVLGVGMVVRARDRRIVRVGLAVGWVTAAVMLINACMVLWLHFSGRVTLWFPVPMSLVLFGVLAAALWEIGQRGEKNTPAPAFCLMGREPEKSRIVRNAHMTVALVVLTGGFVVGEMAMFGQTKYRRQADAIVVLGARAYADGRPSDMLRDRAMTGIKLYHEGVAPKLIFTGGPGDGAFSEAHVMRSLALAKGVPDEAIVMDDAGVNTQASARNVARMLDANERVVLVSHGYHLPRSRMLFVRAGVEATSVPAEVRYTPRKLPVYVVRESIALVWYYFMGDARA